MVLCHAFTAVLSLGLLALLQAMSVQNGVIFCLAACGWLPSLRYYACTVQ